MAELPDCGLYRTGVSLPGHEEEVPGGILIYFHNHSEQGPPLVLTPHDNTHNRWSFHERGWLVEDPGFISALIPLKGEGYYTVSGHHLHVSKEEIIPERTLVQLGYNRRGDTLLFVAEFKDNAIEFPSQGYRFESTEVQGNLASAVFSVPETEEERTLH
jgi:hypothetical protein